MLICVNVRPTRASLAARDLTPTGAALYTNTHTVISQWHIALISQRGAAEACCLGAAPSACCLNAVPSAYCLGTVPSRADYFSHLPPESSFPVLSRAVTYPQALWCTLSSAVPTSSPAHPPRY